jgi:erythromycin esterase
MIKNTCVLAFALMVLTSIPVFAQQNNKAIVESLNSAIRPIEILIGDSSFNDITFLQETLKSKEIIALGEVTHGTAEVFDYNDRLARFLVTNLGYRAIAFEADFIAIEHIDNYIIGETDSIIPAAGTAIRMTNNSMIEWLKRYNRDKIATDKVHVYGLELRNYTNIFNKMLATFPDLDSSDKGLMTAYLAKPFNSKISKEEVKGVNAIVLKLQALPLSDINRQYLDMLEQLNDSDAKRGYRDSYMAKNAEWIKERAKHRKLIVWAHNGHLKKTESYNYPTLGTQLDKKFGSKYYVIGTDFNSGKAYVNIYVGVKEYPSLSTHLH